MHELITAHEALEAIRCTRYWLNKAVAEGALPVADHFDGRRWFDLAECLNLRTHWDCPIADPTLVRREQERLSGGTGDLREKDQPLAHCRRMATRLAAIYDSANQPLPPDIEQIVRRYL